MNAKPKRAAAELRDRAQGAPRPGGRAAARTGRAAQAGPAKRAFPTQGSAALAPRERPTAEPGPGRLPWLKVAPPVPVSVPRAPFILLLLFAVVGGVLGILMVNTKINENAFQLEDLQKQQATLDRQEQDLHKKIADYESPNNLAAAARRLGLVPAGSPAFIRLPDGRVIGVPRPAGGAPSLASGDDSPTGR